MSDGWNTLQNNVSKILKKKISIKDLKHIVAVISAMESAGLDFKPDMSKATSGMTSSVNPYQVGGYPMTKMLDGRDIGDKSKILDNMRFTVDNDIMSRSKKVTFEITDQMMKDLVPGQLQDAVKHNIISSIYRALKKKDSMLELMGFDGSASSKVAQSPLKID